jgi:Zn ribbon nucleic-acid-binding protein
MVENILGSMPTLRDKSAYVGSTDIECPQCNKYDLYVLSDIENSITMECPNCRYMDHKPSNYIEYKKFDGNP